MSLAAQPALQWLKSALGPQLQLQPIEGQSLGLPFVGLGFTGQCQAAATALQLHRHRQPAAVELDAQLAHRRRCQGHHAQVATAGPLAPPLALPALRQGQGAGARALQGQFQVGHQGPQGAPHLSFDIEHPRQAAADHGLEPGERITAQLQLQGQIAAAEAPIRPYFQGQAATGQQLITAELPQ